MVVQIMVVQISVVLQISVVVQIIVVVQISVAVQISVFFKKKIAFAKIHVFDFKTPCQQMFAFLRKRQGKSLIAQKFLQHGSRTST